MIPDYEFSTSAELLCKMDIVDNPGGKVGLMPVLTNGMVPR